MPVFFICYRREDSAGYAGRIFDWLVGRFGPEQIFMDVDAVGPGEDFVKVVENRISSTHVFLLVIGRHWFNALDKDNHRRLENPHDYVRREIEHALNTGIQIVPVLVDGATMPAPEDLPAEISRLSHCNAWTLTPGAFAGQMKRLLDLLEKEKADAERRETERRKREAEERRARLIEEREAAASTPVALRPHQYPIWVLLFCAIVVVSAFTSISTIPTYSGLATQLEHAKAAYKANDYAGAIANAQDVLRSAPTSKAAKLELAKSFLRLNDPEHIKMGLDVLDGVRLEKSEWEEISPLIPPEYRSQFKDVK